MNYRMHNEKGSELDGVAIATGVEVKETQNEVSDGDIVVNSNEDLNITDLRYTKTDKCMREVDAETYAYAGTKRSILPSALNTIFTSVVADDDDEIDGTGYGYQVVNYPTTSHSMVPYDDRELSWLKFNHRVLDLAANDKLPILERVKFLSIVNSNLDEFFSIRVASRLNENSGDEFSKVRIIDIIKECNNMAADIDDQYFSLMKELDTNGITVHHTSSVGNEEFTYSKINKYFMTHIKPALTPLVMDSTRPLPHIKPFCIYIACIIQTPDGERIGLIEIPTQLDRMVKFKSGWYFIEDIIISHMNLLYPGVECKDIISFRLLRDGDSVDIDDDEGYVDTMLKHVRRRILYNDPVRLEVYGKNSKNIVNLLKSSLKIQKKLIFRTSARLKMSDIIQIYGSYDNKDLKYPEFKPANPISEDAAIMDIIEDNDILVHHPYESFNDTVLKLIKEAAYDPDVVSIKMTIYRSGTDSKILKYLLHAAETGKNVTVLVELKARYNESDNIEIAEKLQKAGANVIYGYEQIKTHAKLIHIFKKKGKEVIQYGHIGTGNYSEKNSKIYTDFSFFTCNTKTCMDINNVFGMLTGGYVSEAIQFDKLKVAPLQIRPMLYELIDREILEGVNGYIAIKVNNLSDHGIVSKLYEASNAGVKVDIICRGSCSLIPGVPGYSENITVKSIVGRFLEHSRVFAFGKGVSRVFITSADLMSRNLDRRVEILFEIHNNDIKTHLLTYMATMLSDTYNAYTMNSMGLFNKVSDDGTGFDSQNYLINNYKILANRL